ncbi:hypothetical protein Tco_0576073 [Tanacetum coccineum]
MSAIRRGLSFAAIKQLITQHVADAIAAYEANRYSGSGTKNKSSDSAGRTEEDDDGGVLSEKRTAEDGNRTLELEKVTALKKTKIQEAIRMARDLMDQVVRDKVAKDADNKKGNDMLEHYNSATGAMFIITTVPVTLSVVIAERSVTKQETAGPLLR